METNFQKALHWVRESEGGNDDDPDDHGGRTSRGITQREDDAYRKMAGMPLIDVWKENDDIINDIYHRSYWNPYCPTLPPGIDYMFFDQCVLSGPHQAALTLQHSLGFAGKDLDGHIGVHTSSVLADAKPGVLIDGMADARIRFYEAIVAHNASQHKFLGGWLNRVAFARHNAHTLVAG